jgi:hypothetical protein
LGAALGAGAAAAKTSFPSNPGGNSGVSSAKETDVAVRGGKVFSSKGKGDGPKIVAALTQNAPGAPGPVPYLDFIHGDGLKLNASTDPGLSKAQQTEYRNMTESQRLGLVMQNLGPVGFAGFLGEIKAQKIGGEGGGAAPVLDPKGAQAMLGSAFEGLVKSGAIDANDIDALAASSGTSQANGDFKESGNGTADLSAVTDFVKGLSNDPAGLAFKNHFVAASYDSGNVFSHAKKQHPDAVSLLYAQGTNVLASEGRASIESFLQSGYADTSGSKSSLEAIVEGSVRGEANIFGSSQGTYGSPEVYTGTATLLQQIANDAKGAPIGSGASKRAAAAFNGVADATMDTDRFGLGDENDIVHADVAGSGLRVAASNLFKNALPGILKSSFEGGDVNEINPVKIRNFLQLAFTPQYANKQDAAQIGAAVGAALGGFLRDLETLARPAHTLAPFEQKYGTIFGPALNDSSNGIGGGNDPLQNGFMVLGQILGSAKSAMDGLQNQIASQQPANSSLSWTAAASFGANLALTIGSFALPEIALADGATVDLTKFVNAGANGFNAEQSAGVFIGQVKGASPSANVRWQNAPSDNPGDPDLGNPILQWLYDTVQHGPQYLNLNDKGYFSAGYAQQAGSGAVAPPP